MEHYCLEHKTEYFKKGHMKGYAHPIGDTGTWCNEEKKKVPPGTDLGNGQEEAEVFPEETKEQKPKDKEYNYKSPVNRSVAISYAKDLCVAGKIELKDLTIYADKFLHYIETKIP